MQEGKDFDQLLAMQAFAQQLSTLLGAGVTLARSLALTEQSAPTAGLGEVIADLRQQVERGATLSAAMRSHPGWFGRVAVCMVRAGEIGGVLDETMKYWAGMLDRDLEFKERYELFHLLARLCDSDGVAGPTGEAAQFEARVESVLHDSGERANAYLFCHSLAVMLGSGVPVLLALETAAEFLEEPAQGAVRAAQAGLREGEAFAPKLAQVLPLAVGQLFSIGEEAGTLDRMALKAAEFLRVEVERDLRMAAEGWLKPRGKGA